MARAEKEDDGSDPRDRDNTQKQMAVLHLSVKNILERVYKLMSHSFHVLLQDLIPNARQIIVRCPRSSKVHVPITCSLYEHTIIRSEMRVYPI